MTSPLTAVPTRPAVRATYRLQLREGVDFDRAAARGQRLDIAAGTATRFEPGQKRTVRLVPFGGARVIHGFRGETEGAP